MMNGKNMRMSQAVSVCAVLLATAGFVYYIGTHSVGLAEGVGLFLLLIGAAGIVSAFLYMGMPDKFGPSGWQVRFTSGSFVALIGATMLMGTNGFEWYACAASFLTGFALLCLFNAIVSNTISKY